MNNTRFEENPYTVKIRVKPATLVWLKEHKGKKSAAGFLDELIAYLKQTPQFRKKNK